MPAPNPPAGVARMSISGSDSAATDWTNIFWFLLAPTTPTHADLQALLDAVTTKYQTTWGVHMPSFWTLNEARVVAWTGSTEIEQASAYAISGAITGATPVPANAARLVSWNIGSVYRGGHPRTYLSGGTVDKLHDSRTWEAADVTGVQTDARAFLAGCNALTPGALTSVTLGTLRRFAGGGSQTHPPTYLTPPVFYPYLTANAQKRVCTQRRRLGREF